MRYRGGYTKQRITMEQTEQGNRLIAEYMDGIYSKLPWLELKRYHSDWNALMPVVLKIMREGDGSIQIYLDGSVLSWGISKVIDATNPAPILAVWECVVQYIKNKKQ